MNKEENKKNKTTKKNKGGRPSSYDPKLHPKLAEILASTGRIDKLVAQELGISEPTLIDWKKKYPEFFKALRAGKKKVDDQVVSALLQNALGYEHEEDKIFYDSKRGKPITVKTTRKYAPNVLAQKFWLMNRRPKEWRDRQEFEVGDDLKQILEGIFSKKDKKIEE